MSFSSQLIYLGGEFWGSTRDVAPFTLAYVHEFLIRGRPLDVIVNLLEAIINLLQYFPLDYI